MHDVDRMRLENEDEFDEVDEVDEQGEGDWIGPAEAGEEEGDELEGALDEVEEMELATELLEIGSEAELEQFLGDLFRRVKRKTGQFLRSGTARALGKGLRGIARIGLPIAAGAAGTLFGGPVGGIAASVAADALGRKFGLELEGLSEEEQELEVARRFVRLAADAADVATELQETHPPQEAARIALDHAARRHTPGLLTGADDDPYRRRRRSGRWVRRGNSIVLLDI